MKLKNIKLRVSRATRKKVYLSIAIFSMVLNSFYPFFASYQYVYAEGEAVGEESVSAEEAASQEAVPNEESSGAEGTSSAEEFTDASTETQSEETAVENSDGVAEILLDTTAATANETQQGDILPDGVSDYRSESSTDSASATEIVTDTTDVSDPIVEVIEPVSEETVSEEIEKECMAEDTVIVDSLEGDWELNEETGYYETKENVKLGVKYIFPEDEKVTVTFSCLPKDDSYRSELRIQQVEIGELNLPEEISTSVQYAFDITTDIEEGMFEYDVTLPKPEGVEAEVSYIEGEIKDILNKEISEEDIVEVSIENIEQKKDEGEIAIQDLDHFTIFVVTGSVGPVIDSNANSDYAGFYLRYVGSPAPEGYSHNYQWATPYYLCDPNNEEVTFTGIINASSMTTGGVAFIGLVDSGLLESGASGYQSGAYAYIYKINDTTLRIGPTDGNINNGEIIQAFRDYTIPGNGELSLVITIYGGGVTVKVGNDNPISDTYGDIKTRNNVNSYAWGEFEFGAVPGWDNWGSSALPYNFSISGCREIALSDRIKICHSTESGSNPYIVNNPSKSGDLQGHDTHNGDIYPTSPWGDIIPPFTYWGCPTDESAYNSNDTTLECKKKFGQGRDQEWRYANKTEFDYPGKNWTVYGQAIYNNDCKIPTEGYCGDGVVNENLNEQCDDRNLNDGDGCSSKCKIETPPARCGDGNVNSQAEECDDGNQNNEDYCSNGCRYNFVCLTDGTNMLVNGNFEKPEVTSTYKWDIFNIYDPMLGWNVEWNGGSTTYNSETRPEPAFLEIHRGVNGWLPASGSQYAELDTDWDGPGNPLNNEPATVRVSQNIPVLGGYKYKVEFSYSPRPETDASNNVMYFDWGGAKVDTYSGAGGGNTSWTAKSYEFVASETGITNLAFVENGTADSLGMFLDNVSVTCLGPEVVPVCGDGIINQATEECDGTDGVKSGENFCTPTCQLIPIYDGSHSCSPGTTPVKVGDTYNLSSRDSDGVSVSLSGGKEYLFKVSGVYNFGTPTNRVADAAYWSEDSWGTTRSDLGIWGTPLRGVLSVLGNLGDGVGVIEWDDDKTFNSDHIYQKAFTPKDNISAQFLISDWYGTWYDNACKNQSCMTDNSGTLSLDVHECQPVAEVTICKEDTQQNNLSGWRAALLGTKVDSFDVKSDGTPVTKEYPVGNYVVKASGTYNYGSEVMNADAANSYRYAGLPCSGGIDGWVNGDASACMNHYLNLNPSLSVGPTEAGWGSFFNPAHLYYKGFGGGSLNLKIWDSCSTSGEGCYGDNEGSLNVEVFKGYVGDTGENGCVTFSNVPYGTYKIEETMQDGWANVSGLGDVVIDEPNEKITIVNRRLPTSGDITICKYNDLDRDGIVDDNEPLIEWGMTVVDIDGDDADETWDTSTPGGSCLVLEDMDLGKYEITEDQLEGWTKSYPANSYTQTITLDVDNNEATVNFLNYETPEVTVVATKIVCDYESDLPNYGNGGPNITATTATDFLANHPNCHLEQGWNFQWGDQNDTNPGDDVIGPAAGWATFGPTDENGVAKVTIDNVDSITTLKIREELKYGFIPFTYTTSGKNNTNNVSAELYCGTDVLNYDNEEWITGLQYGQTYYCVAWNVANSGYIQGIKFRDVNGNGIFDGADSNTSNRLNNWTIDLFDKDWNLLKSADTGVDTPGNDVNQGQYRFKNLMAGKYYVCERLKTGWKQTVPVSGSGVIEHNNSRCYEIDLLSGQGVTEKRFGNFELGIVQGMKFNDADGDSRPHESGEEYMNGWRARLYKDWVYYGEVTTPNTAQQGQYKFENLDLGTYYLCEVKKDGWVQTWPNVGNYPIADNGISHPEYGIAVANESPAEDEYDVCWKTVISSSGQQKLLLRFGNSKLSDIHGYKWDDSNGDRVFNVGEVKLSGWEIFIDMNGDKDWDEGEPKTQTSSDSDPMHFGWYKFEGLMPGTYSICEVSQSGWTQTFPIDKCHNVTLPYTEMELRLAVSNAIEEPAPAYNFGNYYIPGLTIAKWNNVSGDIKPGDTVEFKIQVTAHGNDVKNVEVIDLFSAGFSYISGSWTGTLTEPTYASPGVWNLGDMEKGQVKILTYSTVVSDDIDPGVYKDLAFVRGEDFLGNRVLGTSEEEGRVNKRFVGTDVPVVVSTQDPEVDTEVDEETVEEEVLGTSTVRLPATGADTWVLVAVLLGMAVGLSLIFVSRKKKFVAMFFGLLLFAILGGNKAYANSSLIIRVEDLENYYNKPFGVTFVAMDVARYIYLDLDEGRPLTAICKKDGPNDSGWVVFETISSLALGGDTGVCNVESSDLNGNGKYDFMVTLVAGEGEGGESIDSNVVSTTFDNEGPDKPKYIEVNRKSDCKYEIEFKTANDGQTSYVEVYMSDEKEFTAGPGSRIRTIGIGPDEKHKFTEEVAGEKCAHRQYFAVRAFDPAGNGSDVEAEELVDVKYITVSKEGAEEETQEAYASGAASAISGEGAEGAEVVTSEEEIPSEEGSILGEQTQQEETEAAKGFFGKIISSPWTWIVLILGLGVITINGIRKSKKE